MIVKQIPYSYFIQSYEYGPIGRDRRIILRIILLQYLSSWLIVTLICKFDIFQFQDPIKIKEFSETVETDEHRCPPPNLSVMVSFKCFKGNGVIMIDKSREPWNPQKYQHVTAQYPTCGNTVPPVVFSKSKCCYSLQVTLRIMPKIIGTVSSQKHV